jgi:riboflavin kinase/FMN adenylyltransferase
LNARAASKWPAKKKESELVVIREGFDGLRAISRGSVVTIGNFDGVHLGHRQIIQTCDSLRRECESGKIVVVTFEPHPFTVLRPESAPARLTPAPVKTRLLESLRVDELVILAPTPEVLGLSAPAFFVILKDEAKVAHLVEGDTFTFGKGREGTIEKLQEWSRGSWTRLHVVPPVMQALLDLQVVPVSSSLIRFLIEQGRARDAAICLARPYLLRGPVIRGHQRGRTIGIPTANLDCREQLVPADGVYAARTTINGQPFPVALSIGTMPTFGENQRQVEGFIIGFDGDLYGQVIEFEVLDWMREQWKLPSIEALKVQIAQDVQVVKRIVENFSAEPIARTA